MSAKNKPVQKITIWPVTAAIWRNQGTEGRPDWFTVTLERTYKEGEDYKSTQILNRENLLEASKVLDSAHTWIIREEARAREAAKGGEEQ